jgi:hypothetical protein
MVTGEPTFEDLKITRCLLNTNAMGVSSYKGGGLHVHLGNIMINDKYFTVATYVVPVHVPVNPSAMATIIVGLTVTQITDEGAFQVTADDLSQLVTATMSHCGTMVTLYVTKSKLATPSEASEAYIKKLKDKIAELKAKMNPA